MKFTVTEDTSTWISLSDALRHALTLPGAATAVVTTEAGASWARSDDQWLCSGRATGSYLAISTWRPWDDEPWTPEPLTSEHATFAEADQRGAKDGCMAGIERVEVYSPTGVLECLWDKAATGTYTDPNPRWVVEDTGETRHDTIRLSGRWQTLGHEARARHKAETERITAQMRAEGAENRRRALENVRNRHR